MDQFDSIIGSLSKGQITFKKDEIEDSNNSLLDNKIPPLAVTEKS
jgi:hypothetical protein